MLRSAVLPVLALLVLALGALPAYAALWLELDPVAAPPGVTVQGRTGGDGAMPSAKGETLELYLIPESTQLWHRDEERGISRMVDDVPPGATRLAPLVVDEEGNGTTEFVTPDVEPGAYVLVVSCPMCNFSSSEHLATVAEFSVTGGQQGDELPETGSPLLPRLLQGTLAALVLGSIVLIGRRRAA